MAQEELFVIKNQQGQYLHDAQGNCLHFISEEDATEMIVTLINSGESRIIGAQVAKCDQCKLYDENGKPLGLFVIMNEDKIPLTLDEEVLYFQTAKAAFTYIENCEIEHEQDFSDSHVAWEELEVV